MPFYSHFVKSFGPVSDFGGDVDLGEVDVEPVGLVFPEVKNLLISLIRILTFFVPVSSVLSGLD